MPLFNVQQSNVIVSTVNTTDASPTAVYTVNIPTGALIDIASTVVAKRTGGTAGSAGDGARYQIRGLYRNIAGTVSIIGTLEYPFLDESLEAYDATFTVSGASVIIEVTGVVNTNIAWQANTSVRQV